MRFGLWAVLALETFDEFVQLPKLHVAVGNQCLGVLLGGCFVLANQIDPILDVPIWSHDIGAILMRGPLRVKRRLFGLCFFNQFTDPFGD